ncbi:MAG: MmcQ/YjbR family DNA-binding protein [Campylobacteraceae bacterium]|jgi:predicted DNA-binding protein (MmcQ/YjbR family)|nr:MmcQ/YjbR family DNA-binding protein [Campylobacteraceae bacterium]
MKITYELIEQIALNLNGAKKEYKQSWGATLFWIENKMFLLVGDDKENPMMNFKNDEFINIHLREKYPEIIPGYHMNKKHWNSLYFNNSKNIDKKFLEQLIFESYEIILKSLPKKLQLLYTQELLN